jgi:hypothetical protein
MYLSEKQKENVTCIIKESDDFTQLLEKIKNMKEFFQENKKIANLKKSPKITRSEHPPTSLQTLADKSERSPRVWDFPGGRRGLGWPSARPKPPRNLQPNPALRAPPHL